MNPKVSNVSVDTLPIGTRIYVLVTRDERIAEVCGACEGAGTFSVIHKDNQTRALPCGRCKGSGKLSSGESRTVFDVTPALVVGVLVHVGQTEGFASKELLTDDVRVKTRVLFGDKSRFVWEPGPGPGPIRTRIVHRGRVIPDVPEHWYWTDRLVALKVADGYNAELRAIYKGRNDG